jgi:hypothetical protein
LSEQIQLDLQKVKRETIKGFVYVFLILGFIFGFVIAVEAEKFGNLISILVGYGMLVFATLAGLLVQLSSQASTYSNPRGYIEVENGKLKVYSNTYGSKSYLLHECSWHIGTLGEARTFFPGLRSKIRSVIIEPPVVRLSFLTVQAFLRLAKTQEIK